jgi:FlaA1/EpsC-like NDP-sugar epimerase
MNRSGMLKARSLLNRNFAIVLFCDVLLLSFSWVAAYWVRFDFSIPESFIARMWADVGVLPFIVLTKIICLYYLDCYRGMWRFTSLADMINIIKAAVLGSIIIVVGITLAFRFENFPRSIVLIDLCFSVIAISGIRLVIRLFYQHYVPTRPILSLSLARVSAGKKQPKRKKKKLLIIGAGNCGEKIYREIQDNPQLNYKVVGFLDDNPSKIGMMIHGKPVLGIIGDLNRIIEQTRTEEALIAIPSASSQEMRRMVSLCKESGIRFKTVPGYGELIDGKVSVNVIREVAYRDLLHRETVKLDEKIISDYIRGRQVLVTGAGGSIGSELCRQICRFDPATIVLFERAESPLV